MPKTNTKSQSNNNTCKDCGCWNPICKCDDRIFHTHRDKLYEFVDVNTTGKPIEFRSKGQWKRHLKKLGMHDDVQQSVRGEKIREIKDIRQSPVIPQEEIKKDIWKELKARGLNDKLLRRR